MGSGGGRRAGADEGDDEIVFEVSVGVWGFLLSLIVSLLPIAF